MDNRRIIGSHLVLTFLFSWTAWLGLAALVRFGVLDSQNPLFWVLIVIGGISPAIVAFIVRMTQGEAGSFREFLLQHVRFRVHVGWYLYLVLVPFALTALPWFLDFLAGEATEPLLRQPLSKLVFLVPTMILGGGLEEPGWRGLLLPELMKRYSLFFSSLFIGLVWSIWHLPLWLVEGTGQSTLHVGWFFVTVFGLSFLFSILYWKTESIGLCILFHSLFNSFAAIINGGEEFPVFAPVLRLGCCLALFFTFVAASRPTSPVDEST